MVGGVQDIGDHGKLAPALASQSCSPVECISAVTHWLSDYFCRFVAGQKKDEILREDRVFEGEPSFEGADSPQSTTVRSLQRPEDESDADLPTGLVSVGALSVASIPHSRASSGRTYSHSRRHQLRDVGLVLQRGLSEESSASRTAAT